MRRRARVAANLVPHELWCFDPGDWPAVGLVDAVELWRTARNQWARSHEWPGGAVERIVSGLDVRRAVMFDQVPPGGRRVRWSQGRRRCCDAG